MRIRQILEDVGVVYGGVATGNLDMPPAFQGGEHHEQIGGPIPLILIVVPRRVPWLRRNWHTRFRKELLRRLVQADQWTFWIMRSLVNLQYILLAGYERGVGIRWDDPLLLQMRPEKVFFSIRPIVLSLARSTIFSSTTCSSSSCSVHRLRPFGGLEQAKAISFAPASAGACSAAPSKMRGLAEAGECLRTSTASKPSSTSCWRVRAT